MSAQPVSHATLCLIGVCALLESCGNETVPQSSTAVAPPGIRYESHLAAGGSPPSGAALSNSMSGTAAAAKTGASLFTAMNCDGCHGIDAAGWVGPNLSDGRWRYGGSDDEIFSSIYYGRPKGMPAFGGVLRPEGVWQLVTYIKSLPVPARVSTESWETAP
jgi:cytochrome c oxidase cbb3-type subunit 3